MKINEIMQSRIENLVSGRLENSVSIMEVINWLENFSDNEVDMALDIVERLEFFSVPRTIATYSGNLLRIFRHFKEKDVVFLAIGEFAKSGTAMSYFIKQTPAFKNRTFKKRKFFASSMSQLATLVDNESIDPACFLLILIDDFVGSGKSTVDYYQGNENTLGLRDYLEENKLDPALALLSLVILDEGLAFVRSEIRWIYVAAEKRSKVFSRRGSVFGYRPTMLPLREMAYARGVSLVKDPGWSLGYDNSQGLIAFSHTTPNNTLPIIWSSNNGWHPLYPRFGTDKVLRYKKYREQSRYWMMLASEHATAIFPELGSALYSTLNLQLMTIMRLKSSKRSVPVICQLMGLALFEYAEIVEEGKLRGVFDKTGEVSVLGRDFHENLRKKVQFRRNKEKIMLKGGGEIIYLPSTFRGET